MCCLIVNFESNTTLKSLITSTDSATTEPIEKDCLSFVGRIRIALFQKILAQWVWIRLESTKTYAFNSSNINRLYSPKRSWWLYTATHTLKLCVLIKLHYIINVVRKHLWSSSLPAHCRSVVAVQFAVWYSVELQIVQAMTQIVPSFDQFFWTNQDTDHWLFNETFCSVSL